MGSWTKLAGYPLAALACAGLAFSAAAHVLAWMGRTASLGAWPLLLHMGTFIVFPAALLVSWLMMRGSPHGGFWKTAIAGCPRWLRGAVYALFAYALLNFVLFIFQMRGGEHLLLASGVPVLILRGFSGYWAVLYLASLGLLWPALRGKAGQ
jgi:hypothetical protein